MEMIDTNQVMNAYQGSRTAPTFMQGASLKQMKETAVDFEAFFLSQALQPMFANTQASEPFGGGPGDDIWRSMQVDEYGKALARSGGIGIADAVMKQMLQAQEDSVFAAAQKGGM